VHNGADELAVVLGETAWPELQPGVALVEAERRE
jgi:hypothetical protein